MSLIKFSFLVGLGIEALPKLPFSSSFTVQKKKLVQPVQKKKLVQPMDQRWISNDKDKFVKIVQTLLERNRVISIVGFLKKCTDRILR